ncbi:MAG: rhodanese-like domain-containing protein [Pseudomonadota bacterium]|jgi:rhodanese-related sulfurtransferase
MKHLTPKETHEFLKTNPEAVFIDVRSEMEHLFVGHPEGAILIPWQDAPDWEINPDFIAHVKAAASSHRPVVLLCRSGKRSVDAAVALEKAGMTEVYNVLHGFEGDLDEHHHRNTVNGWRFDGLPWTQT